jgi:hypothetical protein
MKNGVRDQGTKEIIPVELKQALFDNNNKIVT